MNYKIINATIVSMLDDSFIYNGVVRVSDGVISYVGTEAEAPEITEARIIDAKGDILMPGLYNCHTHTPLSLLRGYGGGYNLEVWLNDFIFPTERRMREIDGAVYAGAKLAIAEMLAGGIVSFSDMYFGLPDIYKAVLETGIKANLSNGVISFSQDGYDFRESGEYQETIEIIQEAKINADGMVIPEASLHAAATSHPKAWRAIAYFARSEGLGIHAHLSETREEHNSSIRQWGMTPAQAFLEYGIFDGRAVMAHSVWLSNEDREILSEQGVFIVNNPVSNLKLASGICSVSKLIQNGIVFALGTDGMASNNSHDIFEEMKFASLLQKYAQDDPTALNAFETLKMATVNGARAQGREGGVIAVGLDADLILINTRSAFQVPVINPLENLVYNTSRSDVRMTMVRGKILYENGVFNTLDIEAVLADAKRVCARLFDRKL